MSIAQGGTILVDDSVIFRLDGPKLLEHYFAMKNQERHQVWVILIDTILKLILSTTSTFQHCSWH